MNVNEELSSEYRCIGELHVHRATYLIAIFSVGIWLGTFISYFFAEDSSSSAIAFVGLLTSIFLYFGNRRENSFMYTPYLAYNIADAAYTMLLNSIQLMAAFLYLKRKSPTNYGGIKSSGAAFGVLFTTTIIIIVCLLRLYIVYVVNRAYTYLRSKQSLQIDSNQEV